MSVHSSTCVGAVVLGAALVSACVSEADPSSARDAAEMPRTPTLPGIDAPAFPYAQPEEVGLSGEKLDRLSDEIMSWLANGDFVGGEVLIVKDRKTVFHEAYGWSERETRVPMERNSIFSIKSMSKPFTATAILMLADKGELSLDDPVSHYIPAFAGDERTTIRHLLNHTSGYSGGNGRGGPEFDFESLREWVEDWAAEGPTEPFGEYEYSDFNYSALGYIVEEVAEVPIDAFTEERIIRPLGLDDTSTMFAEDPQWRARLNAWYRREAETGSYHLRWRANRPAWPYYPAAWGLFSTTMDYAEFMTVWLDKGSRGEMRLLREATVEEALRDQASHPFGAYGYGWDVRERPKANGMPSFFGHQGGDGTMAVAFPAVDAVVVFLTHSRYGAHLYALIEALSMLEVFDHPGSSFVRADQPEGTVADLPRAERARYVGSYRGTLHGYGSDWAARVWEAEGRLHVRAGFPGERAPFWWWHLVPLGNDSFMAGRYSAKGLEALHPDLSVRFVVEGERAKGLHVTNGRDTLFSGRPADLDRMVAEVGAARSRSSLVGIVLRTLEAEGIRAARERFRTLREASPDSVRLHEVELNAVGYGLLYEGSVEEAIAVFEMNVEAFPEEANPHDSLGDAYRAAGRLEDARRSYERAVALAQEQGHENLRDYRTKLESVTRQLEAPGDDSGAGS